MDREPIISIGLAQAGRILVERADSWLAVESGTSVEMDHRSNIHHAGALYQKPMVITDRRIR